MILFSLLLIIMAIIMLIIVFVWQVKEYYAHSSYWMRAKHMREDDPI